MKKLIILSALLIPTAAVAQGTPTPAPASTGGDPNQTVCRVLNDTGSRLSRTRVCMTRAQWAERRRQMRENIERAQTSQNNPTG